MESCPPNTQYLVFDPSWIKPLSKDLCVAGVNIIKVLLLGIMKTDLREDRTAIKQNGDFSLFF